MYVHALQLALIVIISHCLHHFTCPLKFNYDLSDLANLAKNYPFFIPLPSQILDQLHQKCSTY